MKTKVQLKNLYLIAVIAIGLIGLGVGSTFAMFNASTSIDNPIAFNSNLSSINLLAETIEVTVPAGEDKNVDIVVSNTSIDSLNYTAWYSPTSNDLVVGSTSSNNSYGPVGTLPISGNFTLTVQLRNNGNSPITVTVGVSSSGDTIVLPSGVTVVPAGELPHLLSLSDFTYILGSDQTTISSLSGDFYNQSTQTISEQSNVTLPSSITIEQDEVLLVRYIGSNPEVDIPNTFTYHGDTFNVVLLSYLSDGSNLSTGLFYHNDSVENIYFSDNVKYIALNSSGNGYDNNSMSNMFNGCTSLSNIDLSNIDLDDVTSYSNALTGVSTSTVITVPNCTQYRSFISKFGTSYTGLSATNINNPAFTCYYQEVEYIQSNANSYIDTAVLDSNTEFEIYVKANIISYSGYGYIFGAWTNDNQANTLCYVRSSDGKIGCWVNNAYSDSAMTPFTAQQDFEVLVNNSQFKYNDVTKTSFVDGSSRSPLSIYIFRRNGTPMQSTSIVAKLYNMYIKDNNVLIRNFVPCYSLTTVTNSKGVQVPSGTAGLYDTVNDVFYTNANTANDAAAFTVGPDVNS